eukprot:11372-Eustigmatos_ZCMA.PRE.1
MSQYHSGTFPCQPGSKTVARAYASNVAAPVRSPASTSRASDAGGRMDWPYHAAAQSVILHIGSAICYSAKQNAKPIRGEAVQRFSSLAVEAAEEPD